MTNKINPLIANPQKVLKHTQFVGKNTQKV